MKNFLKKILLISLFIFSSYILVNCDEDEVTSRDYPRIKTLPVTEITSEGAKFSADIIFRGKFDVVNYGFVWGTDENPTKESSDRVIYSDNVQSKSFTEKIETTLQEDVSYFVRSFIETQDFVVYGSNVNFLSLGSGAPKIKSISPLEIGFCDTVYVKGSNFSYLKDQNNLKFGSVRGNIISTSDTLIKTFAPDSINASSLNIELDIQGNRTISEESIEIKKPSIETIHPTSVILGDTITITGKNFTKNNQTNSILINGSIAEVISSSCDILKAIIPIVNGPLRVTASNLTNLASDTYQIDLLEPELLELKPNKSNIGNQIEILGNNFGYLRDGLKIKVDSLVSDIISFENNRIIIEVPDGIYNKRNTEISVFINSKLISSKEFTILDPWLRKSDIPNSSNPSDTGYYGATGFSINGYGYVGLGLGAGQFNSQDFWKYDPSSNSWTEIASFPGTPRYFATSFVIGGEAYVGGGYGLIGDYESIEKKDFWKYNPVSNSWTRIADFPYVFSKAVGLSSKGNGFVVTRNEKENFWKYDPNTNSWIIMPFFQVGNSFVGLVDSGFEIDGDLYVYVSGNSTGVHELHKFDLLTNTWTRKADLPSFNIDRGDTNGVSIDGKGYILNRDYLINRYDPISDSWTEIDAINTNSQRRTPLSFTVNNKIYFGAGLARSIVENDFWEYNFLYEN